MMTLRTTYRNTGKSTTPSHHKKSAQERNFKRWSREEELKWSAEGYGIKNQSWSRKSVDKITATDYRNYFALLEKRSRDKNGSNGSGMKTTKDFN